MALCCLQGFSLLGQVPTEPVVTLQADYPDDGEIFREQATYLKQLRERFHDQGVKFVVCMPPEAARRLEATAPPFSVLHADTDVDRHRVWLSRVDADDQWTEIAIDGAADLLSASLRTPPDHARVTAIGKLLAYVGAYIDDGPAMPEASARLVEWAPHCGFAHAARFIDDLWYRADLPGAHADAERALAQLADDSWPLVRFCDLALRADPYDRALAGKICTALEPMLASESSDLLPALCHLRAALRAAPDSVTVTTAGLVFARAQGNARAMLILAEILLGTEQAERFRDVAERALTAASATGGDPRWLLAARYKLANRFHDDAARARWLKAFIGKDTSTYRLNTEAWKLLVKFDTMGRFDELALALTLRAEEATKGQDTALQDTFALALFANGRFDEAIAAATKACQADGDPRYAGRLARFENTQRTLQRR
jgi:tetratricopeptide (TPR) repeat protein